jgi:hypothetical protein
VWLLAMAQRSRREFPSTTAPHLGHRSSVPMATLQQVVKNVLLVGDEK